LKAASKSNVDHPMIVNDAVAEPMQTIAIGLWGCFFGVVVGILAGSVFAYMRSLRRIARNAALSALASAFYVIAFLGLLPIHDERTLTVFLALVTLFVAVTLTYLLFALLGVTKQKRLRRRTLAALCVVLILALLWGRELSAKDFLILGTAVASLLGLIALGLAVRRALLGDRAAWAVTFGIGCMLTALVGLTAIAHAGKEASRSLLAFSALAATLYLVIMASVLWFRYAYLIELHKLLAYGPSYDPVTRMRSHFETDRMVGAAFKRFQAKPQPMGVMVLTIANLYALERLHGAQAVNHALFVCASRLRRTVPSQFEMGRLGTDGFVLVMPHCKESGILIELAKSLESRLRRPVALSTSRDAARLETDNTVWVADIGVGVLMVSNPESRGTDAIAMAHRMSRTAISYASRIAWFDHSSGETVELPDSRLL
jgi:GGDEF domain-containing protein